MKAVSAPDRHGYFSLGRHAEYTAAMIGRVPFFVEVNAQMPRTFGANQLHVSDVVGFCESDCPLVELPSAVATDRDCHMAELAAERIPDNATVPLPTLTGDLYRWLSSDYAPAVQSPAQVASDLAELPEHEPDGFASQSGPAARAYTAGAFHDPKRAGELAFLLAGFQRAASV